MFKLLHITEKLKTSVVGMNPAFLFVWDFFQSFLYIFTLDVFFASLHSCLVVEAFLEVHVILRSAEKKTNAVFLTPQIEYIYNL